MIIGRGFENEGHTSITIVGWCVRYIITSHPNAKGNFQRFSGQRDSLRTFHSSSICHFMQLPGATAVRVGRHEPPECVRARIVCPVCVYSVFRPTSLRGKVSAPRGETEWTRLCCSTPLRRLERTSSTFSVATWSWWRDPSVVLFCKETRRETCESTEIVCNFFREPVLVEVGNSLFLDVLFQGSFQRSADLCVIIVVSRDTEGNDRWRHRLLKPMERVMLMSTRQGCGALAGKKLKLLSGSEFSKLLCRVCEQELRLSWY